MSFLFFSSVLLSISCINIFSSTYFRSLKVSLNARLPAFVIVSIYYYFLLQFIHFNNKCLLLEALKRATNTGDERSGKVEPYKPKCRRELKRLVVNEYENVNIFFSSPSLTHSLTQHYSHCAVCVYMRESERERKMSGICGCVGDGGKNKVREHKNIKLHDCNFLCCSLSFLRLACVCVCVYASCEAKYENCVRKL